MSFLEAVRLALAADPRAEAQELLTTLGVLIGGPSIAVVSSSQG
jgi:hypothetical protein